MYILSCTDRSIRSENMEVKRVQDRQAGSTSRSEYTRMTRIFIQYLQCHHLWSYRRHRQCVDVEYCKRICNRYDHTVWYSSIVISVYSCSQNIEVYYIWSCAPVWNSKNEIARSTASYAIRQSAGSCSTYHSCSGRGKTTSFYEYCRVIGIVTYVCNTQFQMVSITGAYRSNCRKHGCFTIKNQHCTGRIIYVVHVERRTRPQRAAAGYSVWRSQRRRVHAIDTNWNIGSGHPGNIIRCWV